MVVQTGRLGRDRGCEAIGYPVQRAGTPPRLAVPIGAKLREHGHVVTDATLDASGWPDYAGEDAKVVLLHVGDDWRKTSTLARPCASVRPRCRSSPPPVP